MNKKLQYEDRKTIKKIINNAVECTELVVAKILACIGESAYLNVYNAYLGGAVLKIIDCLFALNFEKAGEEELIKLKESLLKAIDQKCDDIINSYQNNCRRGK